MAAASLRSLWSLRSMHSVPLYMLCRVRNVNWEGESSGGMTPEFSVGCLEGWSCNPWDWGGCGGSDLGERLSRNPVLHEDGFAISRRIATWQLEREFPRLREPGVERKLSRERQQLAAAFALSGIIFPDTRALN